MEKLQPYNTIAEQRYFNEPEFSDAYNVAEETYTTMKSAVGDLLWISGNEREKTSYGISIRWKRMQGLFALIRYHGDVYSPLLMKGIGKVLNDEIKDADKANVDYDIDENPTQYFSYYLEQFSYIIINALKKEMNDRERDIYENNYI